MERKKTKIIVCVLLGIAMAALITLTVIMIVNALNKDKIKVPRGSVLVWRRTAEKYQNGNKRPYLTEERTVDEYGRYNSVTQYEENGLKSKVTQITYDSETGRTTESYISYEYDGETPISRTDNYYDEKGRSLGYTLYEPNGSDFVKSTEKQIVRNADGNVIEEHVCYWQDGDTAEEHAVYEPDKKTMVRRERWFGETEYSIKSESFFDEHDRKISEYYYLDDGVKYLRWSAVYRDDGSREETEYKSEFAETWVTEYDAENRRVKETVSDLEGTDTSCTVWIFTSDANGRRERKEFYRNGELNSWWQDDYNKYGDIVSEASGGSIGGITSHTETVYDDNGRKVSTENTDTGFRTEYVYDRYGNLIKYTMYIGSDVSIWEFEYTPCVIKKEKAAEGEKYYVPVVDDDY